MSQKRQYPLMVNPSLKIPAMVLVLLTTVQDRTILSMNFGVFADY